MSSLGSFASFSHSTGHSARPEPGADLNVIAQRNPIPFFGVGLIAELPEEEILKHADPDDEDGDGISGRPNYETTDTDVFVGRFGLKAQTVSIEGFIRGPLFNHLGITSDPLSNEDRARLPVDSSSPEEEEDETAQWQRLEELVHFAQAAAVGTPNCDLDDVIDPELTKEELFDLVSFSMLLAAPEPEPLNEQRIRGLQAFDDALCSKCHVPRLQGPRGPVHAYSDFLLHDMGPELADGLVMGNAEGSEFRTQPLWGVAASAPYLHDGRAQTIDEAIRMHGGEGAKSAAFYDGMSPERQADLREFLLSLGGREQFSPGLIPPDEEAPEPGAAGGPRTDVGDAEVSRFWAGREVFDQEFGYGEGVGGPRFNGDSCRACHFEPQVGGAGPRGVNVMRHGLINDDGGFVVPSVGTILHKTSTLGNSANFPQPGAAVFEHRQTPSLFGVGLIEEIDESEITAAEDPLDMDGNGISGRVSIVDGGRVGRFGWKAQVPTLREFVRDAVTAELGMTMAPVDGLTFGKIHDNDDVADPEFTQENGDHLEDYMRFLAPPARKVASESAVAGEQVFTDVGCDNCHTPSLHSSTVGPVPLYSDLLLHEILPEGAAGIEEATASMREFRTAPLWGVSETGPYMHSGEADTLHQAILLHAGEGTKAKEAYEALDAAGQQNLLDFLGTL